MGWCWRKYVMLLLLVIASVIITRAGYVESCIEEERTALLDLNTYLKYNLEYDTVPFFDGIGEGEKDKYNCCTWSRVICSTTTQHVVHLDLSKIINIKVYTEKTWVFNVTMLEPFRQLTSLDLSWSHIIGFTKLSTLKYLQSLVLQGFVEGSQINLSGLTSLKTLDLAFSLLNETNLQGIEDLTELQELDLSENAFGGSIFQSLCLLKSLVSLKLFDNQNTNYLDVPPFCLQNMSSLKYLDLSRSNLNGELLPNTFRNHISLEHLDLSDNNFEGKLSLGSFADHNKLKFLDLFRNHLQVQTEDYLWRPSFQLQYLRLQGCSLNKPNGIFPTFLSEQNNLSFIDLSDNNLVGPFPSFLTSNNFIHEDDFGLENDNLEVSYSRRSLETLAMSGNNFHGELPENIGFLLPQLKRLNVSNCHFEGAIPTSIAHMSQLEVLDLSFNNFSGELPRQLLSNLTWLKKLMLNDNHLEGEIIPDYMNLTKLDTLNLRNNSFNGTIKDSLRISLYLNSLDISNNKVVGFLPGWIGQFGLLSALSVSKNSMEGKIPMGICKNQRMEYLDLSENNFNGSIPSCLQNFFLTTMLLRHNKLIGGIPSALSRASNLIALDLRDNQLSGGIPLWINKLQSLQILLLAGNNLRGELPHQLCELKSINLLDLSRNQLSGRILTCLGNMSFGSLPTTIYTFPDATYVYDVQYGVGEIDNLLVKTMYLPYVGFDLSHMSILHLSDNNFSGIIPPELGNLQHIHSINLSHNCLSGSIPTNLSNLKEIEGLDLSYNNLSGVIPYQLVQLNSLETFNVSYNNLTGRTPEAAQFGHFDETSYLGNPGLCVSLLTKSCNRVSDNNKPPLTSTTTEEDGGEELDMKDFLWTFGATSIIAFMATITVLTINRHWREAFFDFVEWHLLWWLL